MPNIHLSLFCKQVASNCLPAKLSHEKAVIYEVIYIERLIYIYIYMELYIYGVTSQWLDRIISCFLLMNSRTQWCTTCWRFTFSFCCTRHITTLQVPKIQWFSNIRHASPVSRGQEYFNPWLLTWWHCPNSWSADRNTQVVLSKPALQQAHFLEQLSQQYPFPLHLSPDQQQYSVFLWKEILLLCN